MCNIYNANLPTAFTLVGTNHLPTIDNQGGIGSCASQSVTRNQFSNAVSRFIHSADSKSTLTSKDNDFCFAPRFTYNFSGAGTVWVYETIKDHGAISVNDCPFEKNENGGSIKVKDGVLCEKSAAWPVSVPGLMKKALKNRLTGYEQIWTVKEPYNEQLTTTEQGKELVLKIKRAVVEGNCVVTGGYPSRWVFGDISNIGTYGKVGDRAVVAASGTAGGGHQVTIVGYDDEITAEFGGVELKGAFIIANSYGQTWVNEGYTFMMYDACNTVSEHEQLNTTKLYSGQMFVTPAEGFKMYSEYLSKKNQKLTFTEVGKTQVEGETFGVYTIFDKSCGKYMGYAKEEADREIKGYDSDCENTKWCFIPYEKLSIFASFNKEEYKEEFGGSYWVYALNRDSDVDRMRFLDAGLSYTASGRALNLATLNSGKYPVAKSWSLDFTEGDFESKLGIVAGKDAENNRIWAVDQFCFTDWKKDVVLGLPELYIDVEIEAADRDSFKVIMTRTDKNGNVCEYMPAMFRYIKHHPSYCNKEKGEYLTFSAKINGEAELGYFSFSYSDLLKYPLGTTAADYKWGFVVEAKKASGVSVKKATLYYGGSDTPLASITRSKKISGKTKFEF